MLECHFCGWDGGDVHYRRDPYAYDVNDEVWVIPMCDECEQERFDAI